MATYDLHFESVAEGQNRGFEFLTFGDYTRHQGIKGPQKMVNRFLKCLLTPVGSDYTDQNYGTSLMDGWGGNVDHNDLYELITTSVRDAEETVRAYDIENFAPTDERLASVTIEEITIETAGDGFTFVITVTNVAGQGLTVLVPFPE